MPAMRRSIFLSRVAFADSLSLYAQMLALPLIPNSVRFAVIGDMGTGERPQYEVAEQMIRDRLKFPFEFVITLGDNLYGGSSPSDYASKFERPDKLLLDVGAKFYAVLGNHDSPNERFYESFNSNTYESRPAATIRANATSFFKNQLLLHADRIFLS